MESEGCSVVQILSLARDSILSAFGFDDLIVLSSSGPAIIKIDLADLIDQAIICFVVRDPDFYSGFSVLACNKMRSIDLVKVSFFLKS